MAGCLKRSPDDILLHSTVGETLFSKQIITEKSVVSAEPSLLLGGCKRTLSVLVGFQDAFSPKRDHTSTFTSLMGRIKTVQNFGCSVNMIHV